MNIAAWALSGILALLFLAAGGMKLAKPKSALQESGMAWVEDFDPRVVKLIGALEVLGGLGLILPAVLNIAPVLVPIAAIGLALIMVGAIVTHLRRGEPQMAGVNAALLVAALLVAIGRLFVVPFGG